MHFWNPKNWFHVKSEWYKNFEISTAQNGSFDFTAVSGIEQSANTIRIEGYLFKRGQNAFRTWNRRWFYLENNKLCYSKRTGDEVTVMEEDLRICLVRPLTDFDRRYCFEIKL